jgi:hypothetical protein
MVMKQAKDIAQTLWFIGVLLDRAARCFAVSKNYLRTVSNFALAIKAENCCTNAIQKSK